MLNAAEFKELIKQVPYKKALPDAIYLHKSALAYAPDKLVKFIYAVAAALKVTEDQWDLVKLAKNSFRLSLLHYPDFFTESYPALKTAITIDLEKLSHRITQYQQQDNPPILHRKETMISPEHECYNTFKSITEEGEQAGLYEKPRLIGFQQTWLRLIEKKGYHLIDGRLFPNASGQQQEEKTGIEREKTAIVRHELSAPMKQLAKHGYLSGEYTVFDYGCGRGDDLRELEAHGIDALGWDPNFRPEDQQVKSDIVNLGFVINVIEDQDERLHALLSAWDLSTRVLVVSVMLSNANYVAQFTPYKDGVITSRNTFQKYYTQSEIKGYLERTLQEDVIAVAPGIFYIFKDKLEEQRYLQSKFKRHHTWQQLTTPQTIASKDKAKLIIIQRRELFDSFWNTCLELGRLPANDEFSHSEEIRKLIGSHKKTFSLLQEIFDTHEFANAQKSRKEDLLIYFAMGLFDKRKPYTQQPEALKRDIKALFNDYNTAINQATELLFAISNTALINEQCEIAHKHLPASILNVGHSLIFHKEHIEKLPLLLRVYIGAALQMYGELDETIDLVKIHIRSGKLTLTHYDDFEKSVPFLVERIKIKMADQDIDFFDYVEEFSRPPLLNKHLLLDSCNANFAKQKSFDKRLSKLLGATDKSEVILSRPAYEEALLSMNKYVTGYVLRSR